MSRKVMDAVLVLLFAFWTMAAIYAIVVFDIAFATHGG